MNKLSRLPIQPLSKHLKAQNSFVGIILFFIGCGSCLAEGNNANDTKFYPTSLSCPASNSDGKLILTRKNLRLSIQRITVTYVRYNPTKVETVELRKDGAITADFKADLDSERDAGRLSIAQSLTVTTNALKSGVCEGDESNKKRYFDALASNVKIFDSHSIHIAEGDQYSSLRELLRRIDAKANVENESEKAKLSEKDKAASAAIREEVSIDAYGVMTWRVAAHACFEDVQQVRLADLDFSRLSSFDHPDTQFHVSFIEIPCKSGACVSVRYGQVWPGIPRTHKCNTVNESKVKDKFVAQAFPSEYRLELQAAFENLAK